MATLGTAYVQIVPSAKGIKGSITNALSGEAQAAGTETGNSIGSFAKSALKKLAIGTAIVGTVKGALDEGAKMQQSYFERTCSLPSCCRCNLRDTDRPQTCCGFIPDPCSKASHMSCWFPSAYEG